MNPLIHRVCIGCKRKAIHEPVAPTRLPLDMEMDMGGAGRREGTATACPPRLLCPKQTKLEFVTEVS